MMIVHPLLEIPIEFVECQINILVIEDKKILVKLIEELIFQNNNGEGSFVLSENYSPISISKNMDIVKDFFSINPNDKKVINGVYSFLEKEAYTSENYVNTSSSLGELKKYISALIQLSDLNLTFKDEINIPSLLKIFDVKIDTTDNSLVLRLIEYMDTSIKYCGTKLFVFINLKSYFANDELLALYKHIFYNKIDVFLIESESKDKICSEEKTYILDIDLCFIY